MTVFLKLSRSVFFRVLFSAYLIGLSCNALSSELTPSVSATQVQYKQWFMGPILTPNPTTVAPGHPGLELVLIGSKNYGFYDSHGKLKHTPSIWGVCPLFDFQIGFNNVLGAELIGSMVTNFTQGVSSTHLTDSIFRLGFQVSTDKEDSWIPDFRILFQETLPTGHYQKLNPQKKGTDSTGQGVFQTGIQFVFQKAFFMQKLYSFRLRGSIGYFVPAPSTVKGLNCYGGKSKLQGTVYPGKYFSGFFYGEYALSKRWALACEFNYQQGEKGRFSKRRVTEIKTPSFSQITILPEIQHTYTESLGIIVGGWFTAAGKNSLAFSKIFGAVLLLF